MGSKDDLKFLDEIEEEGKNENKPTRMILIVAGIALAGVVVTFIWGRTRHVATEPKVIESKDFKGLESQAQYKNITDFAERFAIMAFNMSYTDMNKQTDKVAKIMNDVLMSAYKDAFLDPKWTAFLSDNKAYVCYQEVTRSSVVHIEGNHYWVKVIGLNLFNSDKTTPASQIELPMNLIVVVKDTEGTLEISDFQRF